ncbi:MAG TPA: hypothetical protein VHC90_22120 [Bryobacteraceae bacterium]|nr:hypothetical protein [Bryobacteraceae bacterium]
MNIKTLLGTFGWGRDAKPPAEPAYAADQQEVDVEYVYPDPEVMLANFEKKAEEAAINEGAVSVDAHVVGCLCDLAGDTMADVQLPPYSPDDDHNDRQIDDRYNHAKEQLRRADDNQLRAQGARKAAQASLGIKEERPKVSIAVFFSIITLAVTSTFSLIELPMLQAVEDFQTRLIITGSVGAAIAALIVFATFGIKGHVKNGPVISMPNASSPVWQTIASALMIGGFGLIRLSASTDRKQVELTIALMAIDLAAIMYSKSEAVGYRRLDDEWARRNDGYLAREKTYLDALAEEKCCETKRERALKTLTRREQELTARLKLSFGDSMIKRARAAVYAAYVRGVTRNLGRTAAGKAAA